MMEIIKIMVAALLGGGITQLFNILIRKKQTDCDVEKTTAEEWRQLYSDMKQELNNQKKENEKLRSEIETLKTKMGVSKKISSFTIPLGATVNMDGTAIMQGVAVVFVAQAFGINLTPTDYITVIATATLASIGTAGVPSVGLITLSMVFASVNLPVEGIGLIMGIDRILDMTRTAVNITGDAVCTTIVAQQDNALNMEVFNAE